MRDERSGGLIYCKRGKRGSPRSQPKEKVPSGVAGIFSVQLSPPGGNRRCRAAMAAGGKSWLDQTQAVSMTGPVASKEAFSVLIQVCTASMGRLIKGCSKALRSQVFPEIHPSSVRWNSCLNCWSGIREVGWFVAAVRFSECGRRRISLWTGRF